MDSKISLTGYAENHIKNRNYKGNGYKNMLSLVKKISEHFGSTAIDQVSTDQIHGWIGYLEQRGNQPSTIRENLVKLSNIMKYAHIDGLININPVERIKLPKKKRNPKFHDYQKIDLIKDLELKQADQVARDLYLFSVYEGSLRITEILKLKPSNIKGGRLIYYNSKGGRMRNIPLQPKAKEILQKYMGRGKYIFGLIENENEEHLAAVRSRIYRRLKKIGCMVGIDNLSSHAARGTVGLYLESKGYRLRQIQKVLDHADIGTTDGYMGSLSTKEVDQVFTQTDW